MGKVFNMMRPEDKEICGYKVSQYARHQFTIEPMFDKAMLETIRFGFIAAPAPHKQVHLIVTRSKREELAKLGDEIETLKGALSNEYKKYIWKLDNIGRSPPMDWQRIIVPKGALHLNNVYY